MGSCNIYVTTTHAKAVLSGPALHQVAAGAAVILTQPPLDWPAFEAWMEDARRRGLHEAARLCVGFPCLSSAANCGFWLALCNAGSNAEVRGQAGACTGVEAGAVTHTYMQSHCGFFRQHYGLYRSSAVCTRHTCVMPPSAPCCLAARLFRAQSLQGLALCTAGLGVGLGVLCWKGGITSHAQGAAVLAAAVLPSRQHPGSAASESFSETHLCVYCLCVPVCLCTGQAYTAAVCCS